MSVPASIPSTTARPAVIEDTIIVWSGPPERAGPHALPGLRTSWEDFQRACAADLAYAWARHPWAKLQRDIAAAVFGPGPGGSAAIDAVLSAKAGCHVHVAGHDLGFGRFREIWTASIHLPLAGIEMAGDRAYLRGSEFRDCIGGLLGLAWFSEWVCAALMTTPPSGRSQ